MLPSHNCIIIIIYVQFSRYMFWIPLSRNSMKQQSLVASVNFLVEISGIEPLTSCLQGRRSPSWAKPPYFASEVVGQNGLEPSTSRLSVVCSSQLSYWPIRLLLVESTGIEPVTSCLQGRRSPSWANPPYEVGSGGPGLAFLRKSHGGCNSPPDCCQEPPFESILACCLLELNRLGLDFPITLLLKWWAKMDSNHRPHDYQSCALASWAIGPYRLLTS